MKIKKLGSTVSELAQDTVTFGYFVISSEITHTLLLPVQIPHLPTITMKIESPKDNIIFMAPYSERNPPARLWRELF